MNLLALFTAHIFILVNLIHASTLLHETEKNDGAQYFDCVYVTSLNTIIKYCRRENTTILFNLTIDDDCINEGNKWFFTDLVKQNISPTEVLSWSSSIERADDYAHFYYSRQENFNEEFLCHCIIPGTFGLRCEYELFYDSTNFENAVGNKFADIDHEPLEMQLYGDILCYNPVFECDYGLLCLDWRNICDGEQQCMNGTDEENCDLLEFNECEKDEYRCVNGMCIDEEYWLDGDGDCMDVSDERIDIYDERVPTDDGITYIEPELCSYIPPDIVCEERICSRDEWSCGDGQCISAIYRLLYSEEDGRYCESMREFNYRCETHPKQHLWTDANGLCQKIFRYNDLLDMNNERLSNASKCTYLIRRALSDRLAPNCPRNRSNCSWLMTNVCETDSLYKYPGGPLIRPYLISYYSFNRSWTHSEPDAFSLVGSIKCRGYHGRTNEEVSLDVKDLYQLGASSSIDFLFCNNKQIIRDYQSPWQYDKSCWNGSLTFNKQPYAFFDICNGSQKCISQYRIGDTYFDCDGNENQIAIDKNLCSNIHKHRFQCSNQQPSCLSVRELGDRREVCANGQDEFVDGLDESIFNIECKHRDDDSCQFLKEYVDRDTRINITDTTSKDMLRRTVLPFQSYCDTFWNLPFHFDELSQHCWEWECRYDQYQCQTGQCIEIGWLCDKEWDCPDASDEQAMHLNSQRSLHNQKLPNIEKLIEKCRSIYAIEQPFVKICDVTKEYPCFLANVTDSLNIQRNRPCINLTQIGDGVENCYGGLDEKNTLEDCDGAMLGFSLRCKDKQCLQHLSSCQKKSEWCKDEILCRYKSKTQTCSGLFDVVCFDGSCRENARCNEVFQCPHGEDEYWCPLLKVHGYVTNYKYRNIKRSSDTRRGLFWPIFPSSNQWKSLALDKRKVAKHFQPLLTTRNAARTHTDLAFSFICNRGLAVAYNGSTPVCFCPPSYYGKWCQYFSDRLTVITHLDLTSLPVAEYTHKFRWFKVVVSLLYVERVIDFHEFDVNGNIELNKFVKHTFYLLYSLSDEMRANKKLRYFNRTNIIENQPYSIRFVVYELSGDDINELGSWFYPIYFDFLPAFRLATVLKFPNWYKNSSVDPCANNTVCPGNSTCRFIFNREHPEFWCSCRSGFHGTRCETFEPKCLSYCSSNTLCKPKDRGELRNTDNPLCICPLSRFGPRCNLRHESCNSQPCRNNGTCHLTHDPTGYNRFICICSKNYYGHYCEQNKFTLHININMSSPVLASVIQFYDINRSPLQLLIQHQQMSSELFKSVQYSHKGNMALSLAILKLYDLSTISKFYILYYKDYAFGHSSNISATPEHCPHVSSFPLIQRYASAIAVFKYHLLCQNDTQLFCFHDDNYICICEYEHTRADCLVLNSSLDQCNFCFSRGKCLRGDLENVNDFLCLCPKCSHGRWCEFTTFAFGFTLDSLLVNDSWTVKIVYTCLVALLFIMGIFTNVSSLITFKLPQVRKFTVGNYLYIVSILNQCAILFLLFKFIHILGGFAWQSTVNLISCKIISYLLFVFTRATFWLISWITCDRLLTIIFPTSILFRRPKLAIRISVVTLIVLGVMHIHDILYTTVAVDKCIVKFDYRFISLYNRVNTLLHYLGTFIIQTLAITALIILAARSRAKATRSNTTFMKTFKTMFDSKKELYVTPMIIMLSATPHTILSFSLSCSDLSTWQRHTLLPAYLISYAPQILGFVLFVMPSKGYRQELQKTKIGKTSLFTWILQTSNRE